MPAIPLRHADPGGARVASGSAAVTVRFHGICGFNDGTGSTAG